MLLEDRDVQVVRLGTAASSFLDQWAALWEGDCHATPFQSPTWLCYWNKYFGGSPHHAICTRDVTLVGLLPLNVIENGPHQQAHLLGAGISDHLDGIFLPGNEEEVAKAF